ncbi:MAG: MerR family transcriptional regulator [Anaerolineales bacterium]|nr:MerR family transcriptional regulator [Anaerolineales bacterium]
MEQDKYLINQLARQANVSVRTIRYYINEGLLPSPEVRGRYSYYDENYLLRIRLIKRLQDAFLPLKEIRLQMDALDIAEIKNLLADEDEKGVPGSEISHLEYNVIPGIKETSSAAEYITRILEARPVTPGRLERTGHRQLQAAPSAPLIAKQILEEADRNDTWRRVEVIPGIELHIQDALYKKHFNMIDRLIEFTRNLF